MTEQEFTTFMNDFMSNERLSSDLANLAHNYLSNGLESFGLTQEKIMCDNRFNAIFDKFIATCKHDMPNDIKEQVRAFQAKVVLDNIHKMQQRQIRLMLGIES